MKKQKRMRLNNNPSSSGTLLIVGLGNPGKEYNQTRHNVGFDIIDRLAVRLGVSFKRKRIPHTYEIAEATLSKEDGGKRLVLIKPLTFMNNSGSILPYLMKRHNVTPEETLFIVDNMDLDPGICRFKLKGSTAGHNGLKSVRQHIKTDTYMRLYIGVGHPRGTGENKVIKHVLSRPSKDDQILFAQSFDKASDAILIIAKKEAGEAMGEINRAPSP